MASNFNTLDNGFEWKADKIDWPVTTPSGQGLAGAIASETQVALINPNKGELSYRGISIEELAGKASFEEVAYLLVEGRHWKINPDEFQHFCRRLHRVRQMPEEVLNLIASQPLNTHPTRLLRAAISALGCFDIIPHDNLKENQSWEFVWIISQVEAIVGHIARFRMERKPLVSDYRQSLAKDLLYMILNTRPTLQQEKLLNLLWVTYADHGLDATTFTGMVVGSTKTDPYYNVVAGLSALRGPLIGGAVERVIRMLLGLRDANVAKAWTEGMIAKGYIIPGFGQRYSSAKDPRVTILKKFLPEFAETDEQKLLLEVSTTIEEIASPHLNPKGVYVNINFYSALLFHYLGVDPELGPCIYAIGRMAGLVARIKEYSANNKVFWPKEKYVGPTNRSYVAMEDR